MFKVKYDQDIDTFFTIRWQCYLMGRQRKWKIKTVKKKRGKFHIIRSKNDLEFFFIVYCVHSLYVLIINVLIKR